MFDNAEKLIREAMEVRVKQICDEEATAASARVYQRVREMHGQMATRLFSHTEFSSGRDHLTIRFELKEGEE